MGLLLAMLGFAGATQIRLTSRHDSFAGQPHDNLVALLDSLSAASDRAQLQINQLQRTRTDLLTSSKRRTAALTAAHQQLDALRLLAGTVPAEGPGVTIAITDPQHAVTAGSVLNGIEELRDAGAEAIEIDTRVRVVASTSFTEPAGVLLVDGVPVRSPYVIDAIGSSHTLGQAVVFPGGLSDQIRQLGGTVTVREADAVKVQSLHRVSPPEYAHPTGG